MISEVRNVQGKTKFVSICLDLSYILSAMSLETDRDTPLEGCLCVSTFGDEICVLKNG